MDDISDDLRRSGRDRVSTTITIDGHTVLRKNNYQVRGVEYVWGPQAGDAPQAPAPKKVKTTTAPPKPVREYRPTAAEISRNSHNERVAARDGSKKGLRAGFLARHVDLLSHFCEAAVVNHLKQTPPSTFHPAPVTEQPNGIKATLRDYQLKGLDFMAGMYQQNLSCILGDEMGLGKTLMTISLLSWLKEKKGVTGPSLVICPLSVLSSWTNECNRWNPSLKVFMLHSSHMETLASKKAEIVANFVNYDVILTTYEMAKQPLLSSIYQRFHFNYLVLDEGHKIKGHTTQIAQAVRRIHRGNTLLLTGTPLQNNLVELWSLLNFLYPEIFTTMQPFEAAFDLKENVIDRTFLKHSQELLELFMLRRLKKEVETLLPEKLETKVYCPLSRTQTFWYKSLLLKDLSVLEGLDDGGEIGQARSSVIRNLFMQLRKCCNHPFTLSKNVETNPGETTLEDLVAASGKLSVLDMLLQSLFKKGNRVVLFSQFTMMLDIVEDYCNLRGWKYCRLDGSVSRARRNYDIRRFNEEGSPYFLFLVSTRSGGMGLNLQTADTCVLFDSDWNPQSDIQAMGRVHRIGQRKKVHVYRLVSNGTVEERLLERAEKKLLLEVVNQETKDVDKMVDDAVRSLSAAELFKDIKFGSQAVFGNKSNELPSWEDIDNITDRSRKENDTVGNLTGGVELSAGTFDAEKAFSDSQTFGGQDFRKLRMEMKKKQKGLIPKNLDGIAHLWKEISGLSEKRNRKSRIVQVASLGSGYGSARVPVLASNNYELEHGESSVFARELSHDKHAKFQVPKKKQGITFENQGHCQACGDGGELVCCPRCPCSLHLGCVGLIRNKDFMSCTHHQCVQCGTRREGAGGLLYPCNACARSFCESCLPSEGMTFLESVDRLENLGFHASLKGLVYIHCSPECEQYAKMELGYVPKYAKSLAQVCPEPLDFKYNFGGTIDIEEEVKKVEKAVEESHAKMGRGARRAATKQNYAQGKSTDNSSKALPKAQPKKPLAVKNGQNTMRQSLPVSNGAARSIALQPRLPEPRVRGKISPQGEHSRIISLWLPSGKLGVRIEPDSEGRCRVLYAQPLPAQKLRAGDVIMSVNKIKLARGGDYKPDWIQHLRSASESPFNLVIHRPIHMQDMIVF